MATVALKPSASTVRPLERASTLLVSPVAIFAAALMVRLSLAVLINHTWDTHTWWNVWADLDHASNPLSAIRAPYYQIHDLSITARSQDRGIYYEYWAYPPAMLYVYYPLAKLYGFFHPIIHQFGAAYSFTVLQLPLSFMFFYKLPNMLADMTIGALLWRMAGRRSAIWFLFNPYILLVSNWTFEGVMVAFTLAAVYFQERNQTIPAAISLAVGTAVKIVPIFLAPAFLIYLYKKKDATYREIAIFCGAFGVALLILVAPAIDLMSFVLNFHNQRPGGGLTWASIFPALAANFPSTSWDAYFSLYLGQIGSLLLPLGMLFGIVYLIKKELTLCQLVLAMALVYLASTKLVNEAYLYVIVVLMTVEIARRPTALKTTLRTMFWVVPFVWAMINVPWQGFLVYFLVQVGTLSPGDVRAWADLHYMDSKIVLTMLAVIGVFCLGLYLYAIPAFSAEGEPIEDG